MAKRNALNQLKAVKAGQLLAKEMSIVYDISYAAFMNNMDAENRRRTDAIKRKAVIYGPEQYNFRDYYDVMTKNMAETVKKKLTGSDDLSDTALRQKYESGKSSFKKTPDVTLQMIFFNKKGLTESEQSLALNDLKSFKVNEGQQDLAAIIARSQVSAKLQYSELKMSDATARPDEMTLPNVMRRKY